MMMRMVWQRIGIGLVTLLVVSIIVFVATSILPGDVAQIVLGQSQQNIGDRVALEGRGYLFSLEDRLTHVDADLLYQSFID